MIRKRVLAIFIAAVLVFQLMPATLAVDADEAVLTTDSSAFSDGESTDENGMESTDSTETESDPAPDTDPDSTSNPETDPTEPPETEPDAEPDPEPDTKPDGVPNPGPDAEPDAVPNPEPDGESEPQSILDMDSDVFLTSMEAFVLPSSQVSCSFIDVPTGQWYYTYVAYTTSLGLIKGRNSQEFYPQSSITIAEAVCLAVRIRLLYEGRKDTLSGSGQPWYQPYVDYASQNDMLPKKFKDYTVPCTRQLAAAIFYRALPLKELPAINAVQDIPDVFESTLYYKEILTLYNAGVLTGSDSLGSFHPTESITRAEFVSLLYKLILPKERKKISLPLYTGMAAFAKNRRGPGMTFPDVAKSAWYYDYVLAQTSLGLMQGNSNGKFNPGGSVTLAEAITVAVRVYQKYHGIKAGIPSATGGAWWYTPAVQLAQQYNILPAGWTDYNTPLTRTRLAILIYNMLPAKELTAINEIAFVPGMQAGSAGYSQVLALYTAGVLTGADKTYAFYPNQTTTRAEFAAMLTRLVTPADRVRFTISATPVGEKIVYGKSGRGRELAAYRYGDGKNVMVITFAVHGYEDHWAKDGQELVDTANALKADLEKNMDLVKSKNWSVYILPLVNPDGLYDGYTNNGPGRCTTTYYTGNTLSSAHGVDINRSFPTNFEVNTSARNFTGSTALACAESRALASFVQSVRGSGRNVCIDTHGWTQQIITSTGTGGLLYTTFKNAFPQNTYAGVAGGKGYFTNYTRALGYDSCLFEFPANVYSHNQYLSSGYMPKYISCIKTLLTKY